MAIQLRRGSEADFDGSLLLEGECAIALDTGAFYYKGDDTVYQMATAQTIGFSDIVQVTTPTFTSLPKTFRADGITANHELITEGQAYVSNRASMGGAWTITCGANTITISGTFSGSTATYIKATLGIPQNKVTATNA